MRHTFIAMDSIEAGAATLLAMPLANATVLELFEHLEDCLAITDCKHGLHHTEAFLVIQGLPPAPVVKWLRALGAECDCAILHKLDLGWSAEDEAPRVSCSARGAV
ncbi:MAG: DUF2695 domain-containing protein [Gammaproteobacteria bacterium]|nr:DUF2695 domain-containing protein [Gammaproteobacteria bacterium]